MKKALNYLTYLFYFVGFFVVVFRNIFYKIQPDLTTVFLLLTLQMWIIADRNKNPEK
jgi:hypothetical protein